MPCVSGKCFSRSRTSIRRFALAPLVASPGGLLLGAVAGDLLVDDVLGHVTRSLASSGVAPPVSSVHRARRVCGGSRHATRWRPPLTPAAVGASCGSIRLWAARTYGQRG